MSTKNDALAAWAASEAPTVDPASVVYRGTPESHAAVREQLLTAADSPGDVKAIENLGGRPSLAADGPAGKSPTWQVRAPRDLDEALRARAAAEGRSISDVLRDAATRYLAS
jgi:hypothetical protein